MKIVINPAYRQISSFIERVPKLFANEGVTIYKARNEIKVFEVDGVKVNVKQYKVPNLFNRIVYTFFRASKPYRAYHYGLKLLNEGIETPNPIAYIIITKGGLISRSYFVSIQSSYTHTMYEFGKGGVENRENIIKAFARYTAFLHGQKIYHCDYSPGNILFEPTKDGANFSLVDTNRMSFGEVSLKKGCKNFARLWGKDDFVELVAKEYAKARGLDSEACLTWIRYYRKRFWKRFSRKYGMPF